MAGSLAEHIPMPVFGGLILVGGGELLWGKRHDVLLVLRTSRLSSAAMLLTFLATPNSLSSRPSSCRGSCRAAYGSTCAGRLAAEQSIRDLYG